MKTKKIILIISLLLLVITIVFLITREKPVKEVIENEEDVLKVEQIVFETEINGVEIKQEEIVSTENFVKIHEGGKFYKLTLSQNITAFSILECGMSKHFVSFELGQEKASPKIIDNIVFIQYNIPDTPQLVAQVTTDKNKNEYFLIKKDGSGNIVFEKYQFNPEKVVLSDMIEMYEDVEYSFDITCDDEKDSIIFKTNYSLIDEITKPILIVNGKEYKDMFDEFTNVSSSYYVINLGYYSDFPEIMIVNEEGELNRCIIFGYNGIEMEVITDSVYGVPGKTILPNGKGELVALKKVDGLTGSEYVEAVFTYEHGQLLENNKQDFIEIKDEERILTLLQDLTVYTDKNNESESIIINKNSNVVSNKATGDGWYNIIYNDNEYWTFIEENIELNTIFGNLEDAIEETNEEDEVRTEIVNYRDL